MSLDLWMHMHKNTIARKVNGKKPESQGNCDWMKRITFFLSLARFFSFSFWCLCTTGSRTLSLFENLSTDIHVKREKNIVTTYRISADATFTGETANVRLFEIIWYAPCHFVYICVSVFVFWTLKANFSHLFVKVHTRNTLTHTHTHIHTRNHCNFFRSFKLNVTHVKWMNE